MTILYKKVHIIFNPVAGGRQNRQLHRAAGELTRLGAAVTIHPSQYRRHGTSLVHQLIKDHNPDLIIAAGGDGTVNDIVNGMANSSTPLAVLPIGTTNVLAAEINLPFNPKKWAKTILNSPAKPVYLARANDRYFILMAGIGFDAHVVEAVTPQLKEKFGKFAYAISVIRHVLKSTPRAYRLTVDRDTFNVASVVVANGRYYAGSHVIAPNASLFKNTFEVVLFPNANKFSVLRSLFGLFCGRFAQWSGARIVTASHVSIAAPQNEPVETDGDANARLPVEIQAGAATVNLVVP